MKSLYLLLCLFSGVFGASAQTSYSTIASNRMVQKHHLPPRIKKIAEIDPVRLQVLWNYFSSSFTFSANETDLSVRELLNIQHFDVTEYEHLRQANTSVQFIYRNSIQITLKSGTELNNLLQGYNLDELLNELPPRPFPQWTSSNFTDSDFQNYKEQVWDWARDYPAAYLQLTSDANRLHIRFSEWKDLEPTKRAQILNELDYLIVD
ncbi:MAG: hypothetical protein K0S23_1133 [Fluviicola sp.]|jgi:hypothetical protein|uniref:hypothetical protein n=1 Tax=Fluviicola sp. TaxID=1917219 RepID=UPI002622C081|nr:hypothetical protein [Fluviicola sp.]MDF3026826.1 hypothetical protein [Fluviicola sp.]